MLGSAHDGERANAARLAAELVRTHGLTWDDVIGKSPARQQIGVTPDWTEFASAALRSDVLSPWERGFCHSILAKWAGRELTEKQLATLERIWNKCCPRDWRAA
jgi:hypothetical protein